MGLILIHAAPEYPPLLKRKPIFIEFHDEIPRRRVKKVKLPPVKDSTRIQNRKEKTLMHTTPANQPIGAASSSEPFILDEQSCSAPQQVSHTLASTIEKCFQDAHQNFQQALTTAPPEAMPDLTRLLRQLSLNIQNTWIEPSTQALSAELLHHRIQREPDAAIYFETLNTHLNQAFAQAQAHSLETPALLRSLPSKPSDATGLLNRMASRLTKLHSMQLTLTGKETAQGTTQHERIQEAALKTADFVIHALENLGQNQNERHILYLQHLNPKAFAEALLGHVIHLDQTQSSLPNRQSVDSTHGLTALEPLNP